LFFVPQLAATIICVHRGVGVDGLCFFLLAKVRARAPSKQEKTQAINTHTIDTRVPLPSEVYSYILYPYILS